MSLEFGDRPMFIGGEFVTSDSDAWMESVNPATEEVHGRVPAGTVADVARAVAAATEAQPDWAAIPVLERGARLRELGAEMHRRKDDVLPLEAADTGNTIASLGGDIQLAANYLDLMSGLGMEIKGETVPATPGNIHFTLREPYGVVGRIVPFNHPFLFAGAHLGAPLMAGNTVVLKSPDQSPLSASLMSEICRDVLPPGVVNIVSGIGNVVGDAIVRHPDVRRIGFTGSVPTGMAIQRAAAETGVKHLSLELGGKNPLIAFPDADPAVIAKAAVAGMNFNWSGQSCGSTSRLLLHESLHDDVVERVVDQVRSIRLGDPRDPASEMGPVNSAGHYRHVMAMIESAPADGARVLCGGQRPDGSEFRKGYWVEPTVIGDVKPNMRIAREEVFGPVLAVLKWRSPEEAIAIANDTEYGLTAGVWTENINTAMAAARRLESGLVWINGGGRHFMGTGFSGQKNSGLGREECLDELLSYTRSKAVHIIL
ncbi:MAG: aldehyde dehydrogenase family protein [Gammaproteobacteria bacterium]|nr:aldehyde dehydrogenase family protein [Gammaproteobacteria bacterium]